MRSIILAMQGGVLDRCFLKIAYGRIPQQWAGHRHSNGTFPSQTGQLGFPSQCWSNDFLLRSTTCWQTPLDHWLVGEQHLDPSMGESTWMVTGWVPSKYCNEAGAVIAFLMWSTADWCSGLQTNSLVFLVSTQRLAAMDAKSGIKRLRNWIIPRKVCRFARLVNGSIDSMELIFRGSGWRPSAPMIWPKKGIRVHLNLHSSRLKRRPVSCALWRKARRFSSWSLKSLL